MALLGYGGIVELSREWPDSMICAPNSINFTSSTLALNNINFWTGDRVLVLTTEGVPVDVNNDGYADNPGGHGVYYGGLYELGPSKSHLTGANSSFYKSSNTEDFYNTENTTGYSVSFNGYIRTDALGRVTFYSNKSAAFNAVATERIEFKRIRIVSNIIVIQYSPESAYLNAAANLADQLSYHLLDDESQSVKSVTSVPSDILTVANDPEKRGWNLQCELQTWALNVNAATLDTSAIGEVFGSYLKSMVKAAGRFEFIYEIRSDLNKQSTFDITKLVLLTQAGSKASARFYLMRDRQDACGLVEGSAYYECDIYISDTTINVSADSIVTGSADFVATDEINIRTSPSLS